MFDASPTDALRRAEVRLLEAVDAECGAPSALVRTFLAFHRAHPEVFALFEAFTAEAVQHGYQHFGAKAIAERVRWQVALDYADRALKFDNRHTAYFSRLLVLRHPEWASVFRTRALTRLGDEVAA